MKHFIVPFLLIFLDMSKEGFVAEVLCRALAYGEVESSDIPTDISESTRMRVMRRLVAEGYLKRHSRYSYLLGRELELVRMVLKNGVNLELARLLGLGSNE